MFVQIEGTKKVKHDSLLAHYVRMIGVKSWCALFVASMGILAVFLALLVVWGYGTLVLTGVVTHYEQPVVAMLPSVLVALVAWGALIVATVYHGGKRLGAWSLQFWNWSQNSCSPIEFSYKEDKTDG